jgi:hypothetical protein
MIKIWLLVIFMSMPNAPSIKYNAILYPTEEKCFIAREGYLAAYENKPQSYKDMMRTSAICTSFDAFPIPGFNQTSA